MKHMSLMMHKRSWIPCLLVIHSRSWWIATTSQCSWEVCYATQGIVSPAFSRMLNSHSVTWFYMLIGQQQGVPEIAQQLIKEAAVLLGMRGGAVLQKYR